MDVNSLCTSSFVPTQSLSTGQFEYNTEKSEYFEKKQLCWIIPTVVLNRHLTLDYLNLSCNTFYRALECLNDVLDYSSLPGTMFHWVLEYPNDGLD